VGGEGDFPGEDDCRTTRWSTIEVPVSDLRFLRALWSPPPLEGHRYVTTVRTPTVIWGSMQYNLQ